MYLRMAGSDTLPVRYAYIEFANQHSVSTALQNNGIEFKGKALRYVVYFFDTVKRKIFDKKLKFLCFLTKLKLNQNFEAITEYFLFYSIQHSRVAIIKPLHKTADMAKEEVEEAMRSHQKTPLDQTVVSATSTQRLSIGLQGALAQGLCCWF